MISVRLKNTTFEWSGGPFVELCSGGPGRAGMGKAFPFAQSPVNRSNQVGNSSGTVPQRRVAIELGTQPAAARTHEGAIGWPFPPKAAPERDRARHCAVRPPALFRTMLLPGRPTPACQPLPSFRERDLLLLCAALSPRKPRSVRRRSAVQQPPRPVVFAGMDALQFRPSAHAADR